MKGNTVKGIQESPDSNEIKSLSILLLRLVSNAATGISGQTLTFYFLPVSQVLKLPTIVSTYR
jgi:hypothetical protein